MLHRQGSPRLVKDTTILEHTGTLQYFYIRKIVLFSHISSFIQVTIEPNLLKLSKTEVRNLDFFAFKKGKQNSDNSLSLDVVTLYVQFLP
jgi:hypothetical protein